ncbi:MAG TPA: S9 family peptidase, partial [bacterium]|nr:S9 family peptidase [bacterium]
MAKRKITIDDLLSLKWVSDPQVSPDGTKVAYVLTTVNKDTDTYGADLWIAPLHGEPRQFTNGTHKDTSPRWSPDGRY